MMIDGRAIAEDILREATDILAQIPQPPRIAAVLSTTGDHHEHGSRAFLRLKEKAGRKIGFDFKLYELAGDLTTRQMRSALVEIATSDQNDAVVIQLPLPSQVSTQYILNAVPESKDPDMLSQKAQGALSVGRSDILPPSVFAIKRIFEKYDIDLKGKICAVFGYGLLVGKPITQWLGLQGATVIVINEFTENPGRLSVLADIVIAGVGRPDVVTVDMVRDGATVIDFGATRVGDTLHGDVEARVADKASLMTPVPGGVGPMVVAALLYNAAILVSQSKKKSGS